MRILVVDDNPENRYQLRALLSGNKFDVQTAANGAEALDLARKNPPDLVVSDILMPVMDGFTLCRNWKQDARLKDIPFVFYTATYTDENDREFALSLGAQRFIVKPEEPDVFLRMVREIVQEVQNAPPKQTEPAASTIARVPVVLPQEEESVYLRQYNDVLVRKLEDKITQLEHVRRELEDDIARRKVVEQKLANAAKNWQLTFESANDAIWVLDRDLRILQSNRTAEKLFGRPREELLGKHCWEIVHGATEPISECPAARMRQTMTRETIELQMDSRWVEITVDPILDDAGIFTGAIHFVTDITARKRSEIEKDNLFAQLLQIQKMESVGRLAGGVAHDFNNMLEVILGHVDLAIATVDEDAPVLSNLQEIQKAAWRSAELTRQLLAFARRQTTVPKILDLNDTVAGMLKMLRRLIGEDINLAWVPGPNIWPLMMDPSQIDQILANLCVNARDAIGGVGEVRIETKNISLDESFCADHADAVPGEYVVCSVTDDGCGMGRDVIDHAFEPFFTTKPVGQGTGLGLATVYGIVRQNNGFIDVDSELGEGTALRIYLPRFPGDYPESSAGLQGATPKGQGETILLVEDETTILKMAQKMLERLGYKVLTTDSPEEAVNLARTHEGDIDLLITDVVMPQMNGRDLARQIAAIKPELKCMYMSGYTSDVIAHRGVMDHDIHFLQKPFSTLTLASKVRETLDTP